MKHSFLFLVNRYLTSSFMVRSRALPIALPGEKNKQKTNKQNEKTFHSALYMIYLLCALCVCFVVSIFGTLFTFFFAIPSFFLVCPFVFHLFSTDSLFYFPFFGFAFLICSSIRLACRYELFLATTWRTNRDQ